jgi:hypothetical protein
MITLKKLAPFLLAAFLPRLASAAPRFSVPALTLPTTPVVAAKPLSLPVGLPASLPGPKLPVVSLDGLAKLYGQTPKFPDIDLPGDDDFTAGVTADLVPKKPLAPAGAAAALVFQEEKSGVLDLAADVETQLERLFDGARGKRVLAPAL